MTTAGPLAEGSVVAGRYRVERRLGAGRSAVVYQARDLETRTAVALKLLDGTLLRDPVAVERFRRESAALRHVQHPHIVTLYDLVAEPQPMLVMEYVAGVDAKTHLQNAGAMTVAELLAVATALAGALAACHRQGVLHRDVKPRNVLLDRHGTAKLADFGLAKLDAATDLTATGAMLGTPEYMAPELFRGGRADLRSDLYALGAVLYELLAQRPPHVASSVASLLACHRENAVVPLTHLRPDVPGWLDRIVLRCLAVDPNDRYRSADALARDLARGADGAGEQPARIACWHCQAASPAELPFCAQCGEWLAIAWDEGPYAVVLESGGDPTRLQRQLERVAAKPAGGLGRRIGQPPLVLCAGLSRDASEALVGQLTDVGGTLRITRRPSLRLDVPLLYVVLAGVLLWPLLRYGDALPLPANLGIVAATEAVLIAVYRYRRRPLLTSRELARQATAAPDPTVSAMRNSVRDMRDPGLRGLLARIAAALARIAPRIDAELPPLRATDLCPLATGAAAVAATIADYEVFLIESDAQAMGGRLTAIEWQIERERDPEALARLRAGGEALTRARRVHAAIDEAHARAYAALLAVPAVLERIEDCLARRDDIAAALRELDSALEGLTAPPLAALRGESEPGEAAA